MTDRLIAHTKQLIALSKRVNISFLSLTNCASNTAPDEDLTRNADGNYCGLSERCELCPVCAGIDRCDSWCSEHESVGSSDTVDSSGLLPGYEDDHDNCWGEITWAMTSSSGLQHEDNG